MKIALIGSSSIPSNTANSIQVMKMAQAYTKLGHELRLYLPGKDQSLGWETIARHYGLSEKFPIEFIKSNRFLRGYDFALSAIRKARMEKVDFVHTRHPQCAAWAADYGLPTVFELHDMPTGYLGKRLFKLFISGKGTRELVLITQALSDAIIKEYPQLKKSSLIQVLPDAIDIERYEGLPAPQKARKELDLSDKFTIGYTGHLYAGRGIDLMLSLAQELPALNFLLVGGRPSDVEKVKQKLSQHETKNVSLTGFVPNADLPLYQAACDVLLMPYQARVSASSGGNIASFLSPMKMFEYLASARPILASMLPVFSEILSKENAWMLPADDLSQWKSAILELQADPELRRAYSTAAHKTALNHTWEKRAKVILEAISL